MTDDKEIEVERDVIVTANVSRCCGERVNAPTDEQAICTKCEKECEVVNENYD